ncbi:aldehyde dehydrogenase family protein [Streptomyces solisilvae]|uniref:aldehyde dehydrogenase family protein n=1 Tax=Streptomyces malaysiensis TaxID=92644 RepID=UPI003682677B
MTTATQLGDGWTSPQDARPVDPATLAPLGEMAATTPEALDRAVRDADAAGRGSWLVDTRVRQARLWRWSELLEQHVGELSAALVAESGKPLREAHAEVAGAVEALRYNSALARTLNGRAGTLPDSSQAHLVREPVGVTAFIVPWNWPLLLLVRDLAPALAAGVTAVIKPAPQTTLVTRRAVELAHEAGIGADVVQLAVGDSLVGQALVTHPLVRAVAFTGSTAVGAAIRAAAAPDMTRTLLELGGKASMTVFADARVEEAAETAARASVITTGQMCMACTRLLVERSAFKRARDRVVDVLRSLRVGDPREETTDLGPLISAEAAERFAGYLSAARDQAELLVGGEPGKAPEADGLPGHFVSPAAVTGVDIDSPLVQHDLFGPLLTIEPFDDEDDAVRIANGTPYGLAASVWTGDLDRAWRMAGRLRAGTVWVNGYNRSYAEMPSGGFGSSGLGRTRGVEGMEQFTELKHIHFGTTEGRR